MKISKKDRCSKCNTINGLFVQCIGVKEKQGLSTCYVGEDGICNLCKAGFEGVISIYANPNFSVRDSYKPATINCEWCRITVRYKEGRRFCSKGCKRKYERLKDLKALQVLGLSIEEYMKLLDDRREE